MGSKFVICCHTWSFVTPGDPLIWSRPEWHGSRKLHIGIRKNGIALITCKILMNHENKKTYIYIYITDIYGSYWWHLDQNKRLELG